MNNKHRKTLQAIFTKPVLATVRWIDVCSLFEALIEERGGVVDEAEGSRVCVVIGETTAVFHRPHPESECSKPLVKSVRLFLENAGVSA